MVKNLDYKGLFLWDKNGKRRLDLPEKDGALFEKQILKTESFDALREAISTGDRPNMESISNVNADSFQLKLSSHKNPTKPVKIEVVNISVKELPHFSISLEPDKWELRLDLPLEVI